MPCRRFIPPTDLDRYKKKPTPKPREPVKINKVGILKLIGLLLIGSFMANR